MNHLIVCPHFWLHIVSAYTANSDSSCSIDIHGGRGCSICVGKLNGNQHTLFEFELIAGNHFSCSISCRVTDSEVRLFLGVVDVIGGQCSLNADITFDIHITLKVTITNHMECSVRCRCVDAHFLFAERQQRSALGNGEI